MVQTIYLRHVNLVRNIEKQIWIVDSDADFTLKHLDKFDESNSWCQGIKITKYGYSAIPGLQWFVPFFKLSPKSWLVLGGIPVHTY